MHPAAALTADLGGVARTRDLLARGATERSLAAAVRSGDLRRIRQGLHTTLPGDDPRVLAARLGGRLTGAAALRLEGAWMWRRPPASILLPRHARLRGPVPPGTRVHRGTAPGTSVVVPLQTALDRALRSSTLEDGVILVDWALRTGRLDPFDVECLVDGLPRSRQRIRTLVDTRCESLLESAARTRLLLAGHRVTSQVPVNVTQAIDLVVDGVVGLELDGREFHADRFEHDRAKDLCIVLEGRSALRVSYSMVRDDWPRVHEAIRLAVARTSRQRRRAPSIPAPGMPRSAGEFSSP